MTRAIDEIAERIAAKDADLEAFAQLALEDASVRDDLVRLLTTDSRIMVYYHCYEALALAAEEQPGLPHAYWDALAALLAHVNSYHRSAALAILAHLVPADVEGRIDSLVSSYLCGSTTTSCPRPSTERGGAPRSSATGRTLQSGSCPLRWPSMRRARIRPSR